MHKVKPNERRHAHAAPEGSGRHQLPLEAVNHGVLNTEVGERQVVSQFDFAGEAMIAHHEGAIGMSEQQLAEGQNPDALMLAEKIIADQQTEITEMQEMLTSL